MSSAPAPHSPSRLLPLIGRALVIVILLGGSIAASLFVRWTPAKYSGTHVEGHSTGEAHDGAETADKSHSKGHGGEAGGEAGGEPGGEPDRDAKGEHGGTPATEPAEPTERSIDRLIYNEEFADALELCQTATELWLRYRAAVCLERLEDWKEAAERYDSVTPKATGELWANAMLGVARCRLGHGDLAEADAALQEVERLGGSVRPPARRERNRLRACVEYSRLGTPPAADPFVVTALAWPTAVDRPTGEPIWLPPAPTPPAKPHDQADHSHAKPHDAHSADDSHGKPHDTHDKPREAHPEPAKSHAGHADPAKPHDTPAKTPEQPHADPAKPAKPHDDHGHKEPISVTVPAPVAPAAAGPVQAPTAAGEDPRARVRESLQRVLEEDEDENPTVRLTLANFDAQDGAWKKALPVYRQLIEDDPDSAEAKLASYNLGLGLLKDGQTAAARAAFLGTLDRDPHGPWADLARYWVGRTHLDGGDPTAALRPLGLATLSKSRTVRAAADLARVACHLLRNAEQMMEKEVRELRPDATPAAIALHDVYDAVVRYRTTPSQLRAEQVAAALHAARDLADLGPAGLYLAGVLYQEIGESSQMAKLCDAAAPDCRGPWAVKMTLAAAEHWDSQDKRKEARSRYRAVAAVDPDGLGRRAEQKLAAMALRDGNGRECLARCLRLWKQRPDDPREVLRLMGRGYELTGQPAAAAACYAGREPLLD